MIIEMEINGPKLWRLLADDPKEFASLLVGVLDSLDPASFVEEIPKHLWHGDTERIREFLRKLSDHLPVAPPEVGPD